MPTQAIPLTARMAQNQAVARKNGLQMQERQNHGENVIEVQDSGREAGYVIYVYNILNREYVVNQPPLFPSFTIPACPPGQKVSHTFLPPFVRETYIKPGSTEYYYKMLDGRKAATSLLNPSAFPGTNWDSQIQNWDNLDQQGNNLNLYGVWWSLTMPDETEKLDEEIKIFRARATKTMNALITEAEKLNAAGDLKNITPLMHFAMDYLGKQANWHMSHAHMITCPGCGAPVKEGIAYHKNDFGEKCIVDVVRYKKMMAERREVAALEAADADEEELETVPAAPARRPARKTAAAKRSE